MAEIDPYESPEDREARLAAEQARLRELDDLRVVLGTVEGRRFVWRILGSTGLFHQSFAGEETHRTAFREGRRAEGLKLFADLMEAAPERYGEMMVEASKDEAMGGRPPAHAEKT